MRKCTCDSLDLFKGGCLCGSLEPDEKITHDEIPDYEYSDDCGDPDCLTCVATRPVAVAGEKLKKGDVVTIQNGVATKVKKQCIYPDVMCDCPDCNIPF